MLEFQICWLVVPLHFLGMKSKADPLRPGPPTASRHISYVRSSLGTNLNA